MNEKGEPSCLCIEVRTCRLLREDMFIYFKSCATFDSLLFFFLLSRPPELQAPQEVSVRQQWQDLQEPL